MKYMQYFSSILLLVNLALHSAAAERSRHSWISRIFGREKHASTSDAFTILDETPMYSGWRTIVKRKVRMRNGKVVDFDVSAYEALSSSLRITTADRTVRSSFCKAGWCQEWRKRSTNIRMEYPNENGNIGARVHAR
jgi:hypothetical protein